MGLGRSNGTRLSPTPSTVLHAWGYGPIHREQLVPTDHGDHKRAYLVFTDMHNQARPIDVMIVGATSTQALTLGAPRKRGTAANSGEALKLSLIHI